MTSSVVSVLALFALSTATAGCAELVGAIAQPSQDAAAKKKADEQAAKKRAGYQEEQAAAQKDLDALLAGWAATTVATESELDALKRDVEDGLSSKCMALETANWRLQVPEKAYDQLAVEAKAAACVTAHAPALTAAFAAGVDRVLAAGDGVVGHWGARNLLYWSWLGTFGPVATPAAQLVKGAALRDEAAGKRFAATKTYATATEADCVASAKKLPAPGKKVAVQHHFKPTDTVYVRCYLRSTVGNAVGGDNPRLAGSVAVASDKHPAGSGWKSVAIEYEAFKARDTVDFSYALGEWSQGGTIGTVTNIVALSFDRGFEERFVNDRVERTPIVIKQEFQVTTTFSVN